ncbi:efflux RND transporter permease subunit [Lutimonas sp.]|uniref:efflux RND transporter permease subunit n=1 Tax=Lutimonas sp. TaxID=1872403 RepID=UPI003D9B078F
MKKVISYFIKYHVAVNVIILAVIIFGYLGTKSMKSSFFPLTDSRFINISVVYPGASPQEMEEGVVLKIEDNLKGIVGIDRVTSVSRENSASISIETMVDSDIDVVLAEVKNAVDRVPSFPSGMEPPVIAKIESIAPTINFTVSGTDLPLTTLKQYARDVENDLRAMPGISQISLTGFPDEEIEIAVREIDLRAFDLTFADVAQAVQGSNLLISGGNIKTDYEDYLIRARNRQYYGEDLHNLIVKADQSGNVIYLKDVATVKDRWNENPDRLFYNDEVAISIQVSNTNSEDMIASADVINIYIEKFNAQHDNVQLNVASDRSIVLKQRTDLLTENAVVGILLVLLFLSLFLNVRLAFWVAAGLPIAFLGMFIFAANLGVTINVLSLFGMIIVIGILVDDGIVIGENIYNHYEKGKSPVQAAIDGTMEVIPPIMSAIITTMLAFSIFFFLDGGIGDFFKEVSTVVILTLAVSLVEALIILPAHIAHSKALVRGRKKPTSGLFYLFSQINVKADQFLVFCRDRLYGPYLKFFLKNRFLGLAIPFALLIFSFGGITSKVVRTSFFPNMASDRIDISLAMPQGTNERITDSIISNIEQATWLVGNEYTEQQTGNTPVIENVIKRIGPGSSNASLTINLLPGEFRDFASGDITNAIREKAGLIYGAESLTFGSGMNFGGSPVAVSLLGNNIEELKAAKTELKSALQSNAILKDVSDTDPAGIKEVRIKLKNDAYILGLTLQSVMNQVRSGFFGYQAQRFQRGQDEIKVWVRYEKEDRSSIRNLDDMWISTPTGNKVPFSEIATYDIARGDVAINHLDGRREIQITADMANPKESATDVMTDIKDNILPGILAKYPTVQPSFEGQNREAAKTINSATQVGGIVLVLIYCVIAFTFRSYSQPLLLLIMVPFSLIGIVWGHYIHGFSINILSWLGIIALVGIMVNDGLVLVGKFNSFLKEGMTFNDAMFEAGKSRFRAIFLTSLTTVAGLMPLLLEKSRQAQFLKPMAISISYGIMIATFLTLLMLPLLLSINNSLTVRLKWLITGKMVSKEEVTRAVKELKLEENDEK